jgi:hypothetical protein
MKRQTIIVIIASGKEPETWGNLKKACKAKNWPYNTLSKKQLPLEYDGCMIYRTAFL